MTALGGVIFWLVAAIIFIVLEGVTAQLVSLWFVVGTIPAMIAAGLGGNFVLQGVLFLATSIVVLLFFRPMLQKKLATTRKATNADRVLGMIGIVFEEINNRSEQGRVTANGLEWTARSEQDGVIIPIGANVEVLRIEGVKLIVTPKEEATESKGE